MSARKDAFILGIATQRGVASSGPGVQFPSASRQQIFMDTCRSDAFSDAGCHTPAHAQGHTPAGTHARKDTRPQGHTPAYAQGHTHALTYSRADESEIIQAELKPTRNKHGHRHRHGQGHIHQHRVAPANRKGSDIIKDYRGV